MKYYFITYQAKNRQGSVTIWNEVINRSPMEFIKYVQDTEERAGNIYSDFVVINTCEISEDEYNKYEFEF